MSSSRPGVATSRSTPLPHLPGLRVVGDAAEHGHDGAAAVGAQRLAHFLDLPAELAGGSDDEGGRVGGAAVGDGRACHALQDGQDEGGRLAGTGLRTAHHVASCEHARDGCSWMGVGVSYPMAATPASRSPLRPSSAKAAGRRGSRAGGALGVLALLVALVDALAAAAVAARAAATLGVAA